MVHIQQGITVPGGNQLLAAVSRVVLLPHNEEHIRQAKAFGQSHCEEAHSPCISAVCSTDGAAHSVASLLRWNWDSSKLHSQGPHSGLIGFCSIPQGSEGRWPYPLSISFGGCVAIPFEAMFHLVEHSSIVPRESGAPYVVMSWLIVILYLLLIEGPSPHHSNSRKRQRLDLSALRFPLPSRCTVGAVVSPL